MVTSKNKEKLLIRLIKLKQVSEIY